MEIGSKISNRSKARLNVYTFINFDRTWDAVLVAVEIRINELESMPSKGLLSNQQLEDLKQFAADLRMKLGYVEQNHLGN